MRKAVASILLLALALAIPGSPHTAEAAKAENMIRIATLAPRDSELVRGFPNRQRLQKATGDSGACSSIPSGIAGDEKDVIRKMRVGQMDGAAVTAVGLSQIAREADRAQRARRDRRTTMSLERVQKAFDKEWEQKLDTTASSCWAGARSAMLRYFSKTPVTRPSDFKHMRPWVWPESHATKAMWQAIGCTGVPLGVPEVYGELQTGMVDAVDLDRARDGRAAVAHEAEGRDQPDARPAASAAS